MDKDKNNNNFTPRARKVVELARAEARAEGSLDIYAPDPRLVAYRVILLTGDEYRFWAEDAAHALEQAVDAEPQQEITEVVLGRKGSLL